MSNADIKMENVIFVKFLKLKPKYPKNIHFDIFAFLLKKNTFKYTEKVNCQMSKVGPNAINAFLCAHALRESELHLVSFVRPPGQY